MKKYFAVFALFAAALPISRAQTPITFLNPSFESPAVTSSDFTTSSDDWAITGATAGNFEPSVNSIAPPAQFGSQWGYINDGGSMTQSVSDTFLANSTYNFSIEMGSRGDQGGGATGFIVLGYMDSGTFTPLSSQSGTFASGTYGLVTGASFSTGSSDAELNMPVAIQLSNFGTNQALFDNLQVSVSAIPEPSTYAAIFGAFVLGAAGLREVRRRRSGLVHVN